MRQYDIDFCQGVNEERVTLDDAINMTNRLRTARDLFEHQLAEAQARLIAQTGDQRHTYDCLVGIGNDIDELREQLAAKSVTPEEQLQHARQYLYNMSKVIAEHTRQYNEGDQ